MGTVFVFLKPVKMEAIKQKMDALVDEKKRLNEEAKGCEDVIAEQKKIGEAFDKDIRAVEKAINKTEESLDDTMTAQVTALEILEDEQSKVDERYKQTISKLSEFEAAIETNERERKIFEAKSFAVEEKLELMVVQLEEATSIAEGADRKYEEVARKLKIVEGDLERMVDKSEEFEAKVAESEAVISDNNEQLKK